MKPQEESSMWVSLEDFYDKIILKYLRNGLCLEPFWKIGFFWKQIVLSVLFGGNFLLLE